MEKEQESRTLRKSWQVILGVTISLLALLIAFRGVDWGKVAEAMRQADYIYLLPALGLMGVWLAARGFIWQTILGKPLAYRRVFSAIMAGYLLSNVLPLRLGELGRVYLISRRGEVQVGEALASVVVERIFDMMWILGLASAFLPLVMNLPEVRAGAQVFAGLCLTALAVLMVLARSREVAARLVRWVVGLAVVRRLRLDPVVWEERLLSFLDGLAVLRDGRRALAVMLWGAVSWGASGLFAWMLLLALTPTATLPMGFFVLVMVGLGIAVPSLPGYVGVYEMAVVMALGAFGIDVSTAATYAVLHHGLTFGLTCALGGLAVAREGESLAHLAQAARSLRRSSSSVAAAGGAMESSSSE